MARVCKYQKENMKECKCSNYYITYSDNNFGRHMCRLSEWKKKKGVCPYDKNIIAPRRNKVIQEIKDKKQKTLIMCKITVA